MLLWNERSLLLFSIIDAGLGQSLYLHPLASMRCMRAAKGSEKDAMDHAWL